MERELRIYEMSAAANPTSLTRSRLLQECLPQGYAAMRARRAVNLKVVPLLTDRRCIPLRSTSVWTPHLFHHGIPKVLVNPRGKGITSVRSTITH
jgi:hypothetical protein